MPNVERPTSNEENWALSVGCWMLDVKTNHTWNFFTTTAGFPATTVLGSTLFVTTDPAATTEFSPMVTPLRMTAFIPIQTLSEIMTGAVRISGRGGRSLKNGASACASMMRWAGASGWKSESAMPTFHEMRQWEPISIRSSDMTRA